jgi:hypothetical protein
VVAAVLAHGARAAFPCPAFGTRVM